VTRPVVTVLIIVLIDCEAVEQAGAADALQRLRTASRRAMRRVPRGIAAAVAVGVAHLSAASRAARPIAAGLVGSIGEGSAIGLRAGQHVVRIGLITAFPATGFSWAWRHSESRTYQGQSEQEIKSPYC
jgi:hypothetical protein